MNKYVACNLFVRGTTVEDFIVFTEVGVKGD